MKMTMRQMLAVIQKMHRQRQKLVKLVQAGKAGGIKKNITSVDVALSPAEWWPPHARCFPLVVAAGTKIEAGDLLKMAPGGVEPIDIGKNQGGDMSRETDKTDAEQVQAFVNGLDRDNPAVVEVIASRLTRRGDGVKEPIRQILEFFSTKGVKLAEVDPEIHRKCDKLAMQMITDSNQLKTELAEATRAARDMAFMLNEAMDHLLNPRFRHRQDMKAWRDQAKFYSEKFSR